MIGASLYIVICSARNRAWARLRRLREPRYLLGAIAGGAYLYFSVFGRFAARRSVGRRNRTPPAADAARAAFAASGPALVGIGLMVMTAATWILPFDSGLLDFSEPEIQFLFPAPVSRRSLLLHRMLRSQIGMLFSALLVGIAAPSLAGYTRLRVSVGAWLLMCTMKVYFTGVSLARARLGQGPARARRAAWLPLGILAVAFVIVGVGLRRAFLVTPVGDFGDVIDRLGAVSTSGAARIVLWPFMAVAKPLFAPWPGPYLVGLLESAAVLAASVLWVLAIDSTFEDAASEVAERKAKQPSRAAAVYRTRGAAWDLAPVGRAEGAFFWKGVTQTFRLVDRRSIVRIVAVMIALTMAAFAAGRARGFAGMIAAFSFAAAGFSMLMAPQAVRLDLRQDLEHLELLKTWPVMPSAVVRGEMLWPGALITLLAWAAIALATLLSSVMFTKASLALRLAVGVAAMVAAPALVFGQLAIHNAVALLFPAWVPLGNQRPRGLDAMGQRLIMLGGTWLALAIMVLPGVIAGGIIWLAFRGFVGAAAYIPAAVVGTVIVSIEVLAATEALGPLYERLDVVSVERAE